MGDTATEKKFWVGFDLGGTKMFAKVFDADLNDLGNKRVKTKAWEGVDAGLERMEEAINKALDKAEIQADELAGIGIGSPGPLDLNEGAMLDSPNLGWDYVPLKERLSRTFKCPVVVINDVDAGIYGEYCCGTAKDSHCVLGVFPGTGIGGGCIYDGQIIRGNRASALEIGHMQVMPNGPLCGCGQRGCLEAVASRVAIAAEAASAAYRGEAPNLLEDKGMDVGSIRSGALARSVKAGDKSVEDILRNAAQWLGIGIANAVNLLGPDLVVLGGGLVEELPDLYRDEVENVVHNRAMPMLRDIEVAVSSLGDDASVIGAAAWAAEQFSS